MCDVITDMHVDFFHAYKLGLLDPSHTHLALDFLSQIWIERAADFLRCCVASAASDGEDLGHLC